MKKRFFLLGLAVAAMASCTNSEVTEVAEGKAINFDAFVNKATKAVTEVTQQDLGNQFYVFGHYGANQGTYTEGTVHQNELSTAQYYWKLNKHYIFGAYADGVGGKIDNATFAPADKKLSFPSYTPADAKDLIVAVSDNETRADLTGTPAAVNLSFKHMLSQVGFTFLTKDGENTKIRVRDIKITNAVSKATGSYTKGGKPAEIAWETAGGVEKNGYAYTEITDLTNTTLADPTVAGQFKNEEFKLVIPQGSTDALNVTFWVDFTPAGETTAKSKEFSISLKYEGASLAANTVANTWTPGFRYNYIATITAENVFGLKAITFDVQAVEGWKDATSMTPAVSTLP